MEQTHHRRKLKNYFVMTHVQVRIVLTTLLHMLFLIAVAIVIFVSAFYTDNSQSDELYEQYLTAKLTVVLVERLPLGLAAVIILALLHQIFINHKFCGPLVNFGKTFETIAQGDLTRKVYLRQHDFLHHEARQVNAMMDALAYSIASMRRENSLILAHLTELSRGGESREQLADLLQRIEKHAGSCQKQLLKFNLSAELEERGN
ncbi:MAG: methyl-accepting chemotaxis protein [Desulfobacterales bacterium]|nr:MAG: methyl-accepting chemotaxis protein [Desulfobacterales bacterium]